MHLHVERQHLASWVHFVLWFCVVTGVTAGVAAPAGAERWTILIPVSLVALIYVLLTPLTVRVNSECLEATFGLLGWPRWRFPVGEIIGARVIEFSPLRDFGGWGIKSGPLGMCLNQRGSRGVIFAHGDRSYVIGSDDPEALLQALHTVGVARD